jgi:hypothetical protein
MGSPEPSGYDRQLIVSLLDGGGDDEIAARAGALDAKARGKGLGTEVVAVGPGPGPGEAFDAGGVDELGRAILGRRSVPAPLTRASRVYLVGRGDWRARTLAGHDADAVADLLAGRGLPAVKVISLVADELGRDPGTGDDEPISDAMDSFAAEFHRRLKERHGIEAVVQARVYPTRVVGVDVEPSGDARPNDVGRKLTLAPGEGGPDVQGVHRRPRSKLRFSWEGGIQVREWSY